MAPREHEWFTYGRLNWECCRVCGIVRRADGKNSPCKGPVAVGPRFPHESHSHDEVKPDTMMKEDQMRNRYKIDINYSYNRETHPFGVYVKSPSIFPRWKFICAFETMTEAEKYISILKRLPYEDYRF